MSTSIPPASEVQARLAALSHAQLQMLSRDTKVPFTTLWKIRSGKTSDPRLETVRLIWPGLEAGVVPSAAEAALRLKELHDEVKASQPAPEGVPA